MVLTWRIDTQLTFGIWSCYHSMQLSQDLIRKQRPSWFVSFDIELQTATRAIYDVTPKVVLSIETFIRWEVSHAANWPLLKWITRSDILVMPLATIMLSSTTFHLWYNQLRSCTTVHKQTRVSMYLSFMNSDQFWTSGYLRRRHSLSSTKYSINSIFRTIIQDRDRPDG